MTEKKRILISLLVATVLLALLIMFLTSCGSSKPCPAYRSVSPTAMMDFSLETEGMNKNDQKMKPYLFLCV